MLFFALCDSWWFKHHPVVRLWKSLSWQTQTASPKDSRERSTRVTNTSESFSLHHADIDTTEQVHRPRLPIASSSSAHQNHRSSKEQHWSQMADTPSTRSQQINTNMALMYCPTECPISYIYNCSQKVIRFHVSHYCLHTLACHREILPI